MTIGKRYVLDFMRAQSLAVQSSTSSLGAPQAALVGIAVTERFEVVFDTVDSTRKVRNLRRNPRIAFVIGGFTAGDERSVQFEGLVDEPGGAELDRLREVYFSRFPEGRDRLSWQGIIHMRAKPIWLRFSDFNETPPEEVEFRFPQSPGAG